MVTRREFLDALAVGAAGLAVVGVHDATIAASVDVYFPTLGALTEAIVAEARVRASLRGVKAV